MNTYLHSDLCNTPEYGDGMLRDKLLESNKVPCLESYSTTDCHESIPQLR